MKKIIVAVIVYAAVKAHAYASPYFRPIDFAHPIVSAGILFDPKNINNTAAVTDLALITHSTNDGTIIPQSWQPYFPPEDWVPLEIGGGYGGGNGILNAGTSANFAPTVANYAFKGINASSSPLLRGLKSAFTSGYSTGVGSGVFAFGPSLIAVPVKNGVVEPLKNWMPGNGFGNIINNALRWNVQAAWKF